MLGIHVIIYHKYFLDKILLRQVITATVNTIHELEAPWPSSGSELDHVNWVSQEEVDRILAAVRPTICPLIHAHHGWRPKAVTYEPPWWVCLYTEQGTANPCCLPTCGSKHAFSLFLLTVLQLPINRSVYVNKSALCEVAINHNSQYRKAKHYSCTDCPLTVASLWEFLFCKLTKCSTFQAHLKCTVNLHVLVSLLWCLCTWQSLYALNCYTTGRMSVDRLTGLRWYTRKPWVCCSEYNR